MSFNSAGLVQKRVRDSIILGIRAGFAGHIKFPYVETIDGEFDHDLGKIWIADVTPIESVSYPMIIVDSLPADEYRYLGPDELGDQAIIPNGPVAKSVTFTSIPLSATIKIHTRDTITRDELQGAVYDNLKINREQLANDGVEIQSTKWAPDTREFIEDRWWYISTIQMELYAEYSTSTPITATVTKIKLTEIDIQI